MSSGSDPHKGARNTVSKLRSDFKRLFRSSSPQPKISTDAMNQPGTTSSQSIFADGTEAAHSTTSAPPGQSPDTSHTTVQTSERTVWMGFEAALKVLKLSSNVCPPLQSVASGLLAGIEMLQISKHNRQECEELMSRLTVIVDDLNGHLRTSPILQLSGCIASVVSGLEREVAYIGDKKKQSGFSRYRDTLQEENDLVECYRRVELQFHRLQSNAVLGVWSATNEYLTNTRLDSMQPAKQARYDSAMAAVVYRRECTPNTRMAVLDELRGWKNNNAAKVYWINGMAGTGKTTVAYTFCSELEASHQLAASFFCSHELPDCRDATRIVPTIAYQLARFSYPFQSALCRIIGADPDASTRSVTVQFEKLLNQPLLEVKETMPLGELVVVVDALDECTDRSNVQSFLDALFRCVGALPIKFFITCRPEPGLYENLQRRSEGSRAMLRLHDIERSIVQNDIEAYLTVELPGVSKLDIQSLAELSGKLFIFAATAVRYVKPQNSATVRLNRLETMLSTTWNASDRVYQSIDGLYGTILSMAFSEDQLDIKELETMKHVLYTVVCVKEPMALDSLASLLRVTINDAEQAIEPLRSVLHIADGSRLVSTLHSSFTDYILNSERSGRLFCDAGIQNERLAGHCFGTMQRLLRFNICNLESSYMQNTDVGDLSRRIADNILPDLLYACKYWLDHLCQVNAGNDLMVPLQKFLEYQALFWLEVLSLTGFIGVGLIGLLILHKWLQSHRMPSHVYELIQDLHNFTTIVAGNAVSSSTPHMYVSVLALWDRQQPVWTQYGAGVRGLIERTEATVNTKATSALVVWTTDAEVLSIVISPDGSRIASGCGAEITIWNFHSGQNMFGLLRGHRGSHVLSMAFSPDGYTLVSGSLDCSTCVWDAQTGNLLAGPLQGNTEWVRSVALSRDGLRVVSGSKSGIHTWNAFTGSDLSALSTGHKGSTAIMTAAFSHDSKRIATGSSDGAIQLWDAHTGDVLVGPIVGHNGWVSSIAFSLSGLYVASGSIDHTVRIWDSYSGDVVSDLLEGHADEVTSVAFSPDGGYIASGSRDCTICIWHTQTGSLHAGPLQGHTEPVCSVAFMPDGARIVSGSWDHTIRIWDARASRTVPVELRQKPIGRITSAVVSPDGERIVSGHEDRAIRIWDVSSGDLLIGPLRGHTKRICSVAFSPDGQRIASGSTDETICIWDAQKGDLIARTVERHDGAVLSVAFSPDGCYVAAGLEYERGFHKPNALESNQGGLRMWDVQQGETLFKIWQASNLTVTSTCFSPDGSVIAGGVVQFGVYIWDARTGNEMFVIGELRDVGSIVYSPDGKFIALTKEGHRIFIWNVLTKVSVAVQSGLDWDPYKPSYGYSSVAFLHDSSCVVSGFEDNTICVWDTHTGARLAGPFKIHTSRISSVSLSLDGRRLVSTDRDGHIFVWNLHSDDYGPFGGLQSWSIQDDGWVIGPNSERLLWVMPQSRAWLNSQKPVVVFDRWPLGIDLGAAAVGYEWRELKWDT